MEQDVKNSLEIIFNEIDKLKNNTFQQIKHKHLENSSDIWEAINNTGFYECLKQFKIYGRQYDVNTIINGIKEYIYWSIEAIIEKERWQ